MVHDVYRSPRGHVWVAMYHFHYDRLAAAAWPAPPEGEPLPPDMELWLQRATLTQIERSRLPDYVKDHVALLRVVVDGDGEQRLILACLTKDEIERWTPVEVDLSAGRTVKVNGEPAYLHHWQNEAVAIMQWSYANKRERVFGLWRWEYILACLAPYEPLLHEIAHTALEAEL